MLKQRIITALVLLAIFLPTLFTASPIPFCLLSLVLIAAGAWEWGRLNSCGNSRSLGLALTCVGICATGWWAGLLQMPLAGVWRVATFVWVTVAGWLLWRGVSAWASYPRLLRLAGGLALLCLAWLAVAQARVVGTNFLLSVMALVWVADIAAYFCGRALGGRFSRSKLAPSVSPGKTWEGAWGGLLGVLLLGVVWIWLDTRGISNQPSQYTLLYAKGWWLWLLASIFMAGMSVIGDLIESLIKRSAGVKDSSGLLPGHGGVLDRLDALLPTLPIAMMLHSL